MTHPGGFLLQVGRMSSSLNRSGGLIAGYGLHWRTFFSLMSVSRLGRYRWLDGWLLIVLAYVF